MALRPWSVADAAALAGLYAEDRDEIEGTEPWREPGFFTAAGQRDRIRLAVADAAAGRQLHWVVLGGGVISGTVGLEGIERGGRPAARLGYRIARRFRRRGLGTASAAMARDAAFHTLGLGRLEALALPGNAASRRILEVIGFRLAGSTRLVVHGQSLEHLVYRCDAPAAAPPGGGGGWAGPARAARPGGP